MEKGTYNIGLDIGTNSVGWAVIDDDYNLLKKKKKNLFGVYLFDAGEAAADRRSKRSVRRRLDRRRQRLALLRELFGAEMQKVDPSFFLRLEQSKLNKKDTNKQFPGYTLFNDMDYSDKDFYEKYPTIYHLQKAMIENPETKFDLREIYLVVSHILKFRGNFTDEAQNLDGSEESFSDLLQNFIGEFERQGYGELFSVGQFAQIEKISMDESKNASDRQKELVSYVMGDSKEKVRKTQITEFAKLILGLKGDFVKLFQIDEESPISIKLSDRNVETDLISVQESLTLEQNIALELIQIIYSKIILHKILKDEKYLCFARVKSYEKHARDLRQLKDLWAHDKATQPEKVADAKIAYENYINHGVFADDFYKELDKYLSVAENKDVVAGIRADIEMNNYLPKQRTNQNGAIPFQIYQKELKSILNSQSKYYPFLLEKDQEGLDTLTKILKIHSFRIPYYVGPLTNSKNSKFAWSVRKSEGKILPWNFDDKIDRDKSSIAFISRMTGTDTYLLGEPVVPKYSLLYQKYEVLNELNKVRVNERSLEVSVKQDIFDKLFKVHRKVTEKIFKKYFVQYQGYSNEKDIEVKGLSKITEFSSSLSTYIDMISVFGRDYVEKKENQEFIEELVTWLTVFEDKKILKRRLDSVSEKVNGEQARKLQQYRYTGWGKLSKKLISDLKVEYRIKNTHQVGNYSIVDLLWLTNKNFMQIINDSEIGFDQLINEVNGASDSSVRDAIDNLGGSPAIKKGIRQSVRVVDDIVKVMKTAPNKIFLEFAREEQESVRTNSRYKQLKDKYAAIKKLSDSELPGLLANIKSDKSLAKSLDENKDKLSSTSLFLYYLQGGKSLYSNTPLDVTRLQDYEVDHILPQSYIKDDSIENKALVLKSENQNKTGKLLLPPETIHTMYKTWFEMKKNGLISDKKFYNLTRSGIDEKQMKGFINRQLVETRQIIKNVTNILNDKFKQSGTNTVPVKANLGTEFRQAFNLPKSRNVNDYHHAHDAYLAAMIGTYISRKYPNLEDNQIYDSFNRFMEESRKQLKKDGKLGILRQSYVIAQLKRTQADKVNGEIVWEESNIEKVKKIFQYKQMNIVKKTELRDGALFKETIFAPGKKNNLIPLKKDLDPDLYGGYSSQQIAYSVLCQIDDKKKLVGLPVLIKHRIDDKNDELTLDSWVKANIPYKKNIEILMPQVPIYQKVWSPEKGNLILSSANEVQNGQQMVLSAKSYGILAKLEKTPKNMIETKVKEMEVDFSLIYKEIVGVMERLYPFYKSEYTKLSSLENIEAFSFLAEKEDGYSKQFEIIEELLKMNHQGADTGRLEFGDIKSNSFGRRPHGYEMSNTFFIYQSPTGLFERRKFVN